MPLQEIFINTAYVIFLVALVVKDILWLRIIMTIASFCFVAYAFIVDSWSMQAWNVVFTVINVFQIVRILRERRPVVLNPELKEVYNDCFRNMSRRDFLTFWGFGSTETQRDSVLIQEDKVPDHLYYVLDGAAEISKHGQSLVQLGRLNLLGEMSLLTRKPATAQVQLRGEATMRVWSRSVLDDLQQVRPALLQQLKVSIGQDLMQKLDAEVGN